MGRTDGSSQDVQILVDRRELAPSRLPAGARRLIPAGHEGLLWIAVPVAPVRGYWDDEAID
ncbi:hypothetical protein, partial [Sphingobium sp.]|uniref:hypothetical protein n=1 Tax=Sphingobium sp. TaxID=1912891 RepID=UPI0035C769A0